MPDFREPVTVETNLPPAPLYGEADGTAVWGKSNKWVGVFGVTENATTNGNPAGVYGLAENSPGVIGESKTRIGVLGVIENAVNSGAPAGLFGLAQKSAGVIGVSNAWHGVYGESESTTGGVGVWGLGKNGAGVVGVGKTWHGVYGESDSTTGGAGVSGKGNSGNAGVAGESPNGVGVFGRGRIAGRFEGDMEVTGDIRLTNADCAEDFDIAAAETVDPGTVMVLVGEGALRPSQQAYDKRVAGIVSGAGDYKPALVLDRQTTDGLRQPIALIGKVFCKVDAQYGPVEIGDLLTTSPTPGHAMKAGDPMTAFGSVIGKALRPLSGGQGLIPVLVALQ